MANTYQEDAVALLTKDLPIPPDIKKDLSSGVQKMNQQEVGALLITISFILMGEEELECVNQVLTEDSELRPPRK